MCLLQDAALDLPGDVIQYAIFTALPFYTPKISNSKVHLGLWSCNQEFLFKSIEVVRLLQGFGLNLSNSLMTRRVVKNGHFLPKYYVKLRYQDQYLTWQFKIKSQSPTPYRTLTLTYKTFFLLMRG